ncbi:uncharacterized protein LOC143036224 [Oratosquilla oratoria]|uniref:uncharacterized protein LOC143036224 n=1 Tax=Oratosquilla oratoria TaxID=337810 RepID=UPI003F7782CC
MFGSQTSQGHELASLLCTADVMLRPYKRSAVSQKHHSFQTHLAMAFKLVLLAALVVLTNADTAPAYGHPAPPPQYDFNYAVKDDYSGNDFGHQEARDGYDTQGSYYVQLPDGRLQKVSYIVNGDSGYVAEVTYEGEAQYPEYKPAPPAYAYNTDEVIQEGNDIKLTQCVNNHYRVRAT